MDTRYFYIKFFFLFIAMVLAATVFPQVDSLPDSTARDSYRVINNLSFTGNKVTRDRIIQREILFKPNDTLSPSEFTRKAEQSRKNLFNTSLFNFVTVDSSFVEGSGHLVDVNYDFLERWYIWPVPIFELADRNLNEWLKKMDWNRLNYGMYLTWNNFRGRRESVIVYARFGYDENYHFKYQIPYINKAQTLGIGFAAGFQQNHEIAYNSENNKEIYYKSETSYPRRELFAYSEFYFRKGIHNQHWGMLGYTDLQVADSVLILNPDYSFDGSTQNQSINLYYQYRSDYRDYRQYPLTGHYFDAELDKRGLGLIPNSGVNALSLKANIRKYIQIKGRFYWASGLTVKYSPISDQPYAYTRGLGYKRDYIRGYEYYVVDGQHFVLLKNNLKFELVPQRVQEFKFIPTDKFNKLYYAFYLNLFADLGYVFDNRNNVNNPFANEILPGYGIGLDFVTYYDFVFRLEYSFNKKGESGFFISVLPSI
jgi:outer membrane protein assembly factor BamA